MSLNKKLDQMAEAWEKYKHEDIDEANVTGNVAGYETPKAFGDEEDEKDNAEKLGYKKVKESVFMTMSKMMNEISYSDYKRDETMSSKKKVNKAIQEVNSKLFKIERIINQNLKLKNEDGVDSTKYWKSTRNNLKKISHRMMRISERLLKF
jgi:hypothetical protein